MNGELGTAAGRGDLVRLALRLIVEEALEGEVSDALGRERYERGEDGKAGYRNGYRPGKMKTAEGARRGLSAPQVRDTPEPFVSNVRAALSGRTRRATGGRTLREGHFDARHRGRFHRRDRPAAFVAGGGERDHRAMPRAEYEDFCKRDLSEHAVTYLFIDGIAERLRPGQRRVCVGRLGDRRGRAQIAFGVDGRSKEDAETVRAFFQDLRGRGLGDPLLVVSDGAPGIIRAIEECFPRSARQRCLAHRMRNLASKVPADPWPVPGSKSGDPCEP